jgi:hypothetical protein
MDHDLLIMLYGALAGAGSRVASDIVMSVFQRWLKRRDHERQESEEHFRQATQIYLPTAEEVRAITSHSYQENQGATPRSPVGTGSIVLSVVGGGFLIYQAREPMLSLCFGAMISFMLTNSLLKGFKK